MKHAALVVAFCILLGGIALPADAHHQGKYRGEPYNITVYALTDNDPLGPSTGPGYLDVSFWVDVEYDSEITDDWYKIWVDGESVGGPQMSPSEGTSGCEYIVNQASPAHDTMRCDWLVSGGTTKKTVGAQASILIAADDNQPANPANTGTTVSATVTDHDTTPSPIHRVWYTNPNTDRVTVNWELGGIHAGNSYDPYNAPTSYRIYQGTSNTGSFIHEASNVATSYTATGLSPNTQYFFFVEPLYQGTAGRGDYDGNGVTTANAAPDTPAAPSLTGITTSKIDVSWTPGGGGTPTGYKLYHRAGTSGAIPFTELSDQAGTSYSHTGLTANSYHCYRVAAYNSVGTSSQSTASCQYTSPDTSQGPGQPTLSATGYDEAILTSWGPGAGGTPTSYTLEANTGLLGSYQDVYTGAGTSYWHTDRTNGVQVCYRVTATNGQGTSPTSSTACATPQATPISTPSLTVTPGDGFLDLAWTNSGANVDYTVEADTGLLGAYEAIAETTERAYQHTGLTNGVEICYRIQAERGEATATSSVQCESPVAPTIQVPVVVNVVQVVEQGLATTKVHWDWTHDGAEADNFRVHWREPAASYSFTDVGTMFSYEHDMGSYDEFCVGVRAERSNAANSAWTPDECITLVETPPSQPTGLDLSPGSGSITASWSAPTTGGPVDSYIVDRDGDTATTTSTSRADTGLTNGQEYCYRVAAQNTGGASPYTSQVCAVAGLPADLSWSTTTYTCSGDADGTTWGGWGAEPGATNVQSNVLRISNAGDLNGVLHADLPNSFAGSGASINVAGNVQYRLTQDAAEPACTGSWSATDPDASESFTIEPTPSGYAWLQYQLLDLPLPLPAGTYGGPYTLTDVTP